MRHIILTEVHVPRAFYLLKVRQSLSPQARILFWASMWVRLLVFSPSMLSTQSPTPTPAWVALPPGVSWKEEKRKRREGIRHVGYFPA